MTFDHFYPKLYQMKTCCNQGEQNLDVHRNPQTTVPFVFNQFATDIMRYLKFEPEFLRYMGNRARIQFHYEKGSHLNETFSLWLSVVETVILQSAVNVTRKLQDNNNLSTTHKLLTLKT